MPSGGGQLPSGKPGVERMWAMLDVQAARSASLCWGPNGSSSKRSWTRPVGGSKSVGTNGESGTWVERSGGCGEVCDWWTGPTRPSDAVSQQRAKDRTVVYAVDLAR